MMPISYRVDFDSTTLASATYYHGQNLCKLIFVTVPAIPIQRSRPRYSGIWSFPLLKASSSINTCEGDFPMPDRSSKTKWHWAEARSRLI